MHSSSQGCTELSYTRPLRIWSAIHFCPRPACAAASAALAIWRWWPFLISPSQIQSMYVYSIEMYNKEYLNLKIQVNMYLETKDTERFNLIHQDMKSIISDFNRYERDNICKHRYDSMHVSNILTQLLPYLNKQDVIFSMSSMYRHEYERRWFISGSFDTSRILSSVSRYEFSLYPR